MTWYEKNIEPEILPIVKLLRDNGINTESSCGHRMFVQFQIIKDVSCVDIAYRVLSDAGYRDFRIESHLENVGGVQNGSAIVYFPINGEYPFQHERTSAMEQYYSRKQ